MEPNIFKDGFVDVNRSGLRNQDEFFELGRHQMNLHQV